MPAQRECPPGPKIGAPGSPPLARLARFAESVGAVPLPERSLEVVVPGIACLWRLLRTRKVTARPGRRIDGIARHGTAAAVAIALAFIGATDGALASSYQYIGEGSQRVRVVDQDGNTVATIDLSSQRCAPQATWVAQFNQLVSDDRVYVTCDSDGNMYVFEPPTFPGGIPVDGKLVTVIPIDNGLPGMLVGASAPAPLLDGAGAPPKAVSTAPRVYAVVSDSRSERGAVNVIDAATSTVVDRIAIGAAPFGIDVAPDGRRVYVTHPVDGTLTVVDVAQVPGKVAATLPVGAYPYGVAFHPGGGLAYVAGFGSQTLTVVDTATLKVVRTIPLAERPYGIAVTPDGRRIYVTNNYFGNTVTAIDASQVPEKPVATITVGPPGTTWPRGVAVTPDGAQVWVANKNGNTVVVIDPVTNTVTKTLPANAPSSFARFAVAAPGSAATTVIEYYNSSLDHYFITWVAAEIAKLDAGTVIKGWTRTGRSLGAYVNAAAGTSPICRYYIPPALGDSHFFGRGTVECNATGQKNPSFVLEDAAFMHMVLPVAGACPSGTTNVYRVFSNRPDANHRYMTDKATRDQMVAKGWLAEGDGPDLVVMCAPV